MDCRVKPCNDGRWAKYRRIHAVALGPNRSLSWHGQGSDYRGKPWKDRSQVRCNFAGKGN